MTERNKSTLPQLGKLTLFFFLRQAYFQFHLLNVQQTLLFFKTSGDWVAEDGAPIDCHGGNIIYVDSLKTFFWYGEHYGKPRGAACYSSEDLYNWKNEGVVMTKGNIEILERPKVIYDKINKKYVMWFHYDGNRYTIAELGVGAFQIVAAD